MEATRKIEILTKAEEKLFLMLDDQDEAGLVTDTTEQLLRNLKAVQEMSANANLYDIYKMAAVRAMQTPLHEPLHNDELEKAFAGDAESADEGTPDTEAPDAPESTTEPEAPAEPAEPAPEEPKYRPIEEVRSILANLVGKIDVPALMAKIGAKKLSEVPPEKYEELIAMAEKAAG